MSVKHLANILYTPENIESAKVYLKSRGINSELMRYPPALSGPEEAPFKKIATDRIPAHLYVDTIFFPITDIEDPDELVGFDARFVGKDNSRLRWRKFKDKAEDVLFYYSHNLMEIDSNKPVLVTEGIIDAETLRPLGYPVVSPLTAAHTYKLLCFLHSLSKKVYIAYDNDPTGTAASKALIKEMKIDPDFEKCFFFLNFPGKDPNEAVKTFGKDNILGMIRNQIQE